MNKVKLVSIIVLLFAINTNLFAQFGVRGGLTSSNFTEFEFSPRIGTHLGAYYNFAISHSLSVEPGMFYTQKGYSSQNPKIKENINYIDIPILFRYNVIEGFNVFAGPQVSTPIARRYTSPNNSVNNSLQIVRGYDASAVIGAGYALPSGLNFQASFEIGMVNLNYFDNDVKSQALKISVGKTF